MDELIEALKKLAAGQGDSAAVVKLLKEQAGGLHQAVFQEGFNKGYGKMSGELETATARLTTLTAEHEKAKSDLDKARQQNPDVAKLHAEYAEQIKTLERTHEEAKTALQTKLTGLHAAKGRRDLVEALASAGVDREYAQTVVVNRDDVASRIKVDPATGEVQFLQAGQSIPLVVSGDRSAAELLADELAKKVEPRWLVSHADVGAGPTQPGSPASQGMSKLVDDIKAEAKARKESAEGSQKIGANGVPEGLAHLAVAGNG